MLNALWSCPEKAREVRDIIQGSQKTGAVDEAHLMAILQAVRKLAIAKGHYVELIYEDGNEVGVAPSPPQVGGTILFRHSPTVAFISASQVTKRAADMAVARYRARMKHMMRDSGFSQMRIPALNLKTAKLPVFAMTEDDGTPIRQHSIPRVTHSLPPSRVRLNAFPNLRPHVAHGRYVVGWHFVPAYIRVCLKHFPPFSALDVTWMKHPGRGFMYLEAT